MDIRSLRIRWIITKLFLLAKEYAKLIRTFNSVPPILVYQMGKVGSTSIWKSLTRVWPGAVLQAHSLDPMQERGKGLQFLHDKVILNKKPLYIISLTREPIGRNISAFFHNFERDVGISYTKSDHSIEELGDIFLKNYPHRIPLEWFDENLEPHFGIDVYATEFPNDGIATYECDNVRVLLMRSELSNALKASAIAGFLGLEAFSIIDANVGSEKGYAEIYRDFKREFRLPDWYVDEMYKSKYFTHFYGEGAGEELAMRWGRRD